MPQIRRILFPTDFSERAEAAWDYAQTMARAFGAELHLLHVLQEPVTMLPESALAVAPPAVNMPELMEAAEQGLERLTTSAPATIANRSVISGPTAEEIVRYARDAEIDLIVLGTHGRTGLGRLVFGSVAESVLKRAACDLLLIPAAALPGAADAPEPARER